MEDKVVLITGASSGIGAGTAKKFSKHSASLVLTGRNVENLKAVEEECKNLGAKDVFSVIAEFRNMTDVKNVLDRTIERFGRLDVLVNNAGTIYINCFEEVTMEKFDCQFQVNVRSMFYLTQLAIPHLVKSKGNVVNVSSLGSTTHYPAALVYCMTKATVEQFTKTVALEYAPKGVRVNAVNPALVETNIYRETGMTKEETKTYFKEGVNLHPVGRNGTVEDVAEAIFFLATDSASWITGHCMTLDGGRSLQTP